MEPADDARRRGELGGPGDRGQVVADGRGAVAERARRIRVEQEEADHQIGLESGAVDPPVVFQRRQAAQEHPPLRVVERCVAPRLGGQQRRQPGAQHERRAIATLERLAELEEAPALVVGRGVLDRAHDREDPLVDRSERVAERGEIRHALALVRLHRAEHLVERQEDLEGQCFANRPRVLARLPDREVDRVGVGLVGEERGEVGHRQRRERGDLARELRRGEDLEHVLPRGLGQIFREPLGLGREVFSHEQKPGDVFCSLQVPPHPIQRVGNAGEHQAFLSARTQVSLLPPPWEELTTYEPGLSATRVRPPGRTRTEAP